MSRLSLSFSLLALALVLGACDAGAPTAPADAALASPSADAKAGHLANQITESIGVSTEGDVVLLEVDGKTIALGAGEAYVLGQTIARVGYESFDPKLAAEIFPGGGDKCEPPPPGSGVRYVGGLLFGGGGGCPPPPPPIFLEPELFGEMMAGSVKIVEAPEADWTPVPGGFVAPY